MSDKELLEVVEKKVIITSDTEFDPKEYFKDREGLYVSSNFDERILSKAEKFDTEQKFSIAYFKLTKNADDATIEAQLPEQHIFTESEVCAIIANLIDKQSKGEEGILDNDSRNWNLFYTPSFVVGVDWGGSFWVLGAWDRRGNTWVGGERVCSPATDIS